MVKAAVLYETNKPLQIKELVQDPPKAGEVLFKLGAAGICGSDQHMMTGRIPLPLPIVTGHEAGGTVVEVGEGVTRVKPGDRCLLSFVSNCGHCRTCRSGLPNICETNLQTGVRQLDGTVRLHDGDRDVFQMGKVGAFAEYTVIPQQACHQIPDDVSFRIACLMGCCVTTGVGGVINNPAARPGMSVAVFGCGGVGLNVIQGARLIGASRIIAVDIRDHKLESSYKFGTTDVLNSLKVEVIEAIRELTGDGVDMAFDCYGSPGTTADAVRALRRGGTAVVIGMASTDDAAPVNLVELVRGQKSLVGSYYGSASPHETFKIIIDLYRKGKIDIDSLIARTYSLEQVNEGFDAIARGEDGRGVILFNQ